MIWKGKGYLTLLYLIGVMGGFGAIITIAFGEQIFDRLPWLFGIGFVLASAANWIAGRRINKRKLWFDRASGKAKSPLLARHTFCFVAMDYWSIPFLICGLLVIGKGLFAPH